jgi:archaemetzincin
VSVLYVTPVGTVASQPLDWIEAAAADWFPFPVARLLALALPEGSYDAVRGQYRSVEIMKALAQSAPADAAQILGVTEADLAIPALTFLFGQAQYDGPVALVSLCRLRQEFYGLPPNAALLRERVTKEMLHEMGHTFGLAHCPDAGCAMCFSADLGLVDAKSESYCRRCGAHLARRFGGWKGEES